MKRIFHKRVRYEGNGVNVASDVNVAAAGSGASASSRMAGKISQSGGGSYYGQPDGHRTEGERMSEEKKHELSTEELEAQTGEKLPDREEMSLVNANVAVPVNAAVSANVLSDDATAIANAQQESAIDQANQ